jgi:hypothetical protein
VKVWDAGPEQLSGGPAWPPTSAAGTLTLAPPAQGSDPCVAAAANSATSLPPSFVTCLVLSRKYPEMPLANLAAAGRAVRDAAKG